METSQRPGLSLNAAIEQLQRIQNRAGSQECRLVIRKYNPGGFSAHQTTEVEAIHAGFDWESGRVVIQPGKPLTELTAEQVDAIQQSVRNSSSWHAYQAQKKLLERIAELEAEVARLRAGGTV